jgi:hypothetical protein
MLFAPPVGILLYPARDRLQKRAPATDGEQQSESSSRNRKRGDLEMLRGHDGTHTVH